MRAVLVADTAIALLAERGMRGLTHRAVDEAAALPPGSTSNLARTRAALLELALARLTELEEADWGILATGGPIASLHDMGDLFARSMHKAVTVDRARSVARYELALEATRRPELRKIYDEIGARFREPAIAMFTMAGSPDSVRHGRQLVAFSDGLLFDAVVGAGPVPSLADLRAAFTEFLRGTIGAFD